MIGGELKIMTERCFVKQQINEPEFKDGTDYFGQRSISISAELECSADSACILNKIRKSHVDMSMIRTTDRPDYSYLSEKNAEQMPEIRGAMEYSASGSYFEDEFIARVEREEERMKTLCEDIRIMRRK